MLSDNDTSQNLVAEGMGLEKLGGLHLLIESTFGSVKAKSDPRNQI
jgi:hypothetical protein